MDSQLKLILLLMTRAVFLLMHLNTAVNVSAATPTYLHTVSLGVANDVDNYFSIGQKKMRTKTHDIFEKDMDASAASPGKITVKVFGIKTTLSRTLLGWLHFEVSTLPKAFNFLYMQVEDENGNAIGEFLDDKVRPICKTSCSSSRFIKGFHFPTPAADLSAAQVPFAILAVHPNELEDRQFATIIAADYGTGQVTTVCFVWRHSHYSCNKPEKIRLRVVANLASENDPVYFRGNWLHTDWVGGFDFIRPTEILDCQALSLPNSIQGSTNVSWITRIAAVPPYNDDVIIKTASVCKPVAFDKEKFYSSDAQIKEAEKKRLAEVATFSGRCLYSNSYLAKTSSLHACPNRPPAYVYADTYSGYLMQRKECMKVSECPCKCKTNSSTRSALLTINKLSMGKSNSSTGIVPFLPSLEEIGVPTNSTAGARYLRGRKAHGISMIFITMVFVPFSITIARYFKESWLKYTKANIRVWYWVHLTLTFCTICMYIFSLTALHHSKKLLGISHAPVAGFHRVVGNLTVVLYTFTFLSGPIRHTKKIVRTIQMFAHAWLGILYYFFGMISVMTSSWIPGSPSATKTMCNTAPGFSSKTSKELMPSVLMWIAFDVIQHFCLTRLVIWADKSLEFHRSSYFPLVPVMRRLEEHTNMKGFRYRNILLIVFAVINAGITIKLLSVLNAKFQVECGFGAMSCTHTDDGMALSSTICGLRRQ